MSDQTPKLSKSGLSSIRMTVVFLAAAFFAVSAPSLWAGSALTAPAPVAGQGVSGVQAPDAGSSSIPQKISLAKVSGKVSVKKEGGLLFEDARDLQTVKIGDTIKVDEGACDLVLENNTTLTLAPGTTLTVTQATYDQISKNRTTLLKLDVGRLKATVGKLHGGSRFEVTTPTALAAVRGTVLYLDAGSTLGKLFTELYVDESAGGVLFRNTKTGTEFLVPAFGGSNSFGDGSLLAPRVMNEIERKQFVDHWENQLNEVLAQLQIEEQANNADSGEGEDGESDDSKKSEQNTSGNAALDKLLKLLQKYNDNLSVIGPLFTSAVLDLKEFNDIEVPDPQILADIREDLLENVTDFQCESDELLGLIASGEDMHATLLDDKEELKDLRNELKLTYIEAASILLNDSYVDIAEALGLEFDELLEMAYEVLEEYGFTIESAEAMLEDLLQRQHDFNVDFIEDKAGDASCLIRGYEQDIPDTNTSREQLLLQSEGLSEILAQGNAGCETIDEWAYDTVKYGATSHFMTESFGNGDLGVVASSGEESEFLQEGDGGEGLDVNRAEITSRTRDLEAEFSSDTIQGHVEELEELRDDLEDLAEDADEILRNKAFVASAKDTYDEFTDYLEDTANPDLALYKTLVSDSQKIAFLREVERQAIRTEIRRELDRIKGDLDLEQQIAQAEQTLDAQTGKVFKDIHGNRVRVDQYIFMPNNQSVEILSLTLRTAEGPQRGISAFSFGVNFNRPMTESDGLLRDLPWSDYLNVVTQEELTPKLENYYDDPGYDQYIVHENHAELAQGENALYPKHFYAEFRNPQGDREGGDVIRFSETYSDPLTLEFASEEEGEEEYYPPTDVLVQGREIDSTLIQPFGGDQIELTNTYDACEMTNYRTLSINGYEMEDFYVSGDDGVQSSGFFDDANPEGGAFIDRFGDINYYRNHESNQEGSEDPHVHPAFFEESYYVPGYFEGEGDFSKTLIGVFVPIDNSGKIIHQPGFSIEGLRDLVSPNPLVNGGNYNLEVMFYYGSVEYTEESGENGTFVPDFTTDVVITPEIFKYYDIANHSDLFPASLSEDDHDNGEEE